MSRSDSPFSPPLSSARSGRTTCLSKYPPRLLTAPLSIFFPDPRRFLRLGSGHYTTMSYSDALETWLTYDDSTVSPAAVEDVCAAQAYLLFYHLK